MFGENSPSHQQPSKGARFRTNANVRYRRGRAYYAQEADYIQIPAIEAFTDAESFYSTLVAELRAAFLCADLELTPEVRDDHTSYIASWLEVPRLQPDIALIPL